MKERTSDIDKAAGHQAKVNREYKDSVLVDLFCEDISAKENQLSFYNALYGTNYTLNEMEIKDIRISNTIYMNFRNDMSFEYNGRLVILAEHQSTVNNNMPLRNLMNIGRIYEQLVPVRDRYRRKMVQIPRPEFYVLYNGKEKLPEESTLRLSDAYIREHLSGIQTKLYVYKYKNFSDPALEKHESTLDNADNGGVSLELTVKVLNINSEAGADILKKCRVLDEYSQFVSIVRKHKDSGEENAMELAIKECIRKDILKEYLLRRGSEVVNMLCAEYDYDMDMAVQREESYEDGYKAGEKSGYEAGELKSRVESILELLNGLGEVPTELEDIVKSRKDIDVLKKWFKLAMCVSSIDEFKKEAGISLK